MYDLSVEYMATPELLLNVTLQDAVNVTWELASEYIVPMYAVFYAKITKEF